MKSELDTLFLPFLDGLIEKSEHDASILFLNGRYHSALRAFDGQNLLCQQVFKSYADSLIQKGIETVIEPDLKVQYSHVFLLAGKNQRESENMLAKALLMLRDNGFLIMAADNKSGGTRLKKMLDQAGFSGVSDQSKNKARVVWAQKPQEPNHEILKQWLALDHVKDVPEGFQSRLGLYGWDKVDKGSKLLSECLPQDLKGKGADFGCGYGYLSKAVLEKNRKIKALDFIDADARALPLCEANIAGFEVHKMAGWIDLSVRNEALDNKYDWIVMNPPFHEGKKSDHDIGCAFIKNASKALKKKGQLWMVANRHLPYETVLQDHFWSFEMVKDATGFKVFQAAK